MVASTVDPSLKYGFNQIQADGNGREYGTRTFPAEFTCRILLCTGVLRASTPNNRRHRDRTISTRIFVRLTCEAQLGFCSR